MGISRFLIFGGGQKTMLQQNCSKPNGKQDKMTCQHLIHVENYDLEILDTPNSYKNEMRSFGRSKISDF